LSSSAAPLARLIRKTLQALLLVLAFAAGQMPEFFVLQRPNRPIVLLSPSGPWG
tara:strand:+ start:2161 stop:2322 length:162 start_codon:yes stop_codon:yes gene_type:complete